MRELVNACLERLATLTWLRMADVDLGQLEANPAPALSFPAALVTISNVPFENLGPRVQQATATLTVRVAFRTFERTHTLAPNEWRTIGLQHFDQLKELNDILYGLNGSTFSDLTRVDQYIEKRSDLRVFTITYHVWYVECIGTPEYRPWVEAGGEGDRPEPCITSTISNV